MGPFLILSLFTLYLFCQSFCSTSVSDEADLKGDYRQELHKADLGLRKEVLPLGWENFTRIKNGLLTKGVYSCCCLVSDQSGFRLANCATQSGPGKDAESGSLPVGCPDTNGSCWEQVWCCICWKIQDVPSGPGLSEC